LKEISAAFPDKKIIMSGILVQQVQEVPANVRLLRSMEEILNYAQE
jgi:hypothetical protein